MFVNTPGHVEEIHVRLRARNPLLIGARIHASQAELVDHRVANRPAVGYLPVPGVLHEDTVAWIDRVAGGRVLVAGVRIANEDTAQRPQILIAADRLYWS